MIGGRVLDLSAVLAFARQHSVYLSALVWTAVEEDIVLLIPSTVCGLAWSRLDPAGQSVLEVLLGLPIVVVDDLTGARAREIGRLLHGRDARLDVAHATACARHRGWPVVTAEADSYGQLEDGLVVEPLP